MLETIVFIIVSLNPFNRQKDNTPMFAVQTDKGVMYLQKSYLVRKCESLGLTLEQFLGNPGAYRISVPKDKVFYRKANESFTYIDSNKKDQTVTPTSDYVDVNNISLNLSESGSLNSMIANAVAAKIAGSLGLGSVAAPAAPAAPVVNEVPEIIIKDEKK